MRLTSPLVLAIAIFALITSCKKEYSDEVTKNPTPNTTDSLPANYPFSTGLCDAITLGVDIGTISNYQPDTTIALDSAVMLDMPAAGDQGSQGSCAAWAVVYALGSYHVHETTGELYSDTGNLSPKFTYNQIAKGNCGCSSLADHLYLLREEGAPSLSSMPYDPTECLKQPDSLQIQQAVNAKITQFEKVNMRDLSLIKRAMQAKKPIAFGMQIDEGFERLHSPYIWKAFDGSATDGHAMVIIGYDDSKHAFRVLNSWSTAWADGGEAWIDYDFLVSQANSIGFLIL